MKRIWVILPALFLLTCEDKSDDEPPTASFNCPPTGSWFEGPIVKIPVQANDNNKVDKVELWFKKNVGGVNDWSKSSHYSGISATASPWVLEWNVVESGLKIPFSDNYNITVVAYDKAGNSSNPEDAVCNKSVLTHAPILNVSVSATPEKLVINWAYQDNGFGFQKYVVSGTLVDETITDINTTSYTLNNFGDQLAQSEILKNNIKYINQRYGAELKYGVTIFDSKGKGYTSYGSYPFYVPNDISAAKAYTYDKDNDQFTITWNKSLYDVEIFEIDNIQYYNSNISNFDKTSLAKITDNNDTTFVYSNFGGLKKRKYLFIDYVHPTWGLRQSDLLIQYPSKIQRNIKLLSSYPYTIKFESGGFGYTVDWGDSYGQDFLFLEDAFIEDVNPNIGPYKVIKNPLPRDSQYDPFSVNPEGNKILIPKDDNIYVGEISDSDEVEFKNITEDWNGWSRSPIYLPNNKIIYSKEGLYGNVTGYNDVYLHMMNDDGSDDYTIVDTDYDYISIRYISQDRKRMFLSYSRLVSEGESCDTYDHFRAILNTGDSNVTLIDSVRCKCDCDVINAESIPNYEDWGLQTKKIENNLEIYKVNLSDKSEMNITNYPSNDQNPIIDDTRQKIYFFSDRDLMKGLYSMNFDGSDQELLVEIESFSTSGDWRSGNWRISIDGKFLFFVDNNLHHQKIIDLESNKLYQMRPGKVYFPR